jgi:hypothetical protein
MEPLDDLKNNWNKYDSDMNRSRIVHKSSFRNIILSGANREKNQVIQYFWAAFVYQIILYALFCWTLFRNMGNRAILLTVLAGLCTNIPFTWVLLKRFKIMYGQSLSRDTPGYSIKTNIELYFTRLSAFFRFKKFADGILLPVNAFIAAFILFELYTAGGFFHHFIWGPILFAGIWLVCGIAVWLDNKNNFRKPLHNIALLLQEFEQTEHRVDVAVED